MSVSRSAPWNEPMRLGWCTRCRSRRDVGQPKAEADRSLDAAIWALSRGHPFMIVEAIAHGEARGTLARRGPSPAARARNDHGAASSSRIPGLSTGDNRLGDRATIHFALLRAASGLSDLATAEAVEELTRRGVITVVGTQLDCTHDRIREVLRSALVPPVYKALHLAIARAIEIGSRRRSAAALRAARHSFLGGRGLAGGRATLRRSWTPCSLQRRDAGRHPLFRIGSRRARPLA